MDVDTIHAMKPVLVTDVSDNINVLQKDDVTKQRTVLTARAIEDVFKCAPIRKTDDAVELHPDNAYFDENGKLDLDKIVTAQSRAIDAESYIHGPDTLNNRRGSCMSTRFSMIHLWHGLTTTARFP